MIKISENFISANGKRAGIRFSAGPWAAHVNPATIKIRAKRGFFPAEIRAAVNVENNSDLRTDYFEGDCIRLVPGDALYELAKAAAQ